MSTQKIVNYKTGAVIIEKPVEDFKDLGRLLELAAKIGCNLHSADLTGAYLEHVNISSAALECSRLVSANLSGANLIWSDLCYANIKNAYLFDANLQRTTLMNANLCSVNLVNANLHGAWLRDANLAGANLANANLTFCFLTGANLKDANLPSPTTVLLADWERLSYDLTADLMVWDSLNHPDPTAFDRWANGGSCPYSETKVQRAANFRESQELWGKGKVCSPYELMQRVLAEKCPPWTREQEQEFDHQFNTEIKGATE